MILGTSSALVLALLAGPALAEVTVIDGAGRELTFEATPERVVALYNDAFGQMATLGVRPVATLVNPEMAGDEAYYFEDGESIPLVANMDGTPDPEIIASFEPDLIVTWSAEEAASFDGIAPVFVMHDGGPDQVRRNLLDLGAILGVADRAGAELAEFDARVAAYAARPGPAQVAEARRDGRGQLLDRLDGRPGLRAPRHGRHLQVARRGPGELEL